MSVKVKGIATDGDCNESESNEDIDKMYQQFDSQVLYNPTNKFKAMRRLLIKGPNISACKFVSKTGPGISEHSKPI